MADIYQASPSDAPKITETVVGAFWNYPVMQYFYPDEKKRGKGIAATGRFILKHAFEQGLVLADGPDCRAIAVWVPSEFMKRSLWQDITFGGLRLAWSLGPGSLLRHMQVEDFHLDLEFQEVPEPHYYLAWLAVRPGHQGQGLGAKMLRASYAALPEKRPYYLETHDPNAKRFYDAKGWTLLKEGIVPKAGCRYWAYKLEPAR